MKKILQTTLITAALINSPSFADTFMTPNAQRAQDHREVMGGLEQNNKLIGSMQSGAGGNSSGGIAGLEAYLTAQYNTAMTWIGTQNTVPTPSLKTIQTINETHFSQISNAAAQKATADNLHNSLLQFPYALYKNNKEVIENIKAANGEPYSTYFNNNSLLSLSIDDKTQAADTLYIMNGSNATSGLLTALSGGPDLTAAPKNPSDDYLNFATLISPNAYDSTSGQEKDAHRFVKYAAQSTINLLPGDTSLHKLAEKPKDLAAALTNLKNNKDYQSYIFKIRSLLALRSMSIYTLNQLIAERTPASGLGAAAGLTTDKASPLQVQAYQAEHRIQDPKWYTSVENANPTTLQRQTLFILAEIEQQNFQAHMDRERILAMLTAMNLQTSSATATTQLTIEMPKLEDAIKAAIKATASSSSSTVGPASAPTATPVARPAPTTKKQE